MADSVAQKRWRDRASQKATPVPLCWCGTKLIRSTSQQRGTCSKCNRAEQQKLLMRARRAQQLDN